MQYTDSEGKIAVIEPTSADSTNLIPIKIINYVLQDLAEPSSTITYLGKIKNDSTYLIVKLDSSSGLSMRYANLSNNSGYATYALAWAARASLTYELLNELTGV